MWEEGWIKQYQQGEIWASELVTEAYKRECELDEVQAASQRIMDAEDKESWADLDYYVIDSAGQTVVVDDELADRVHGKQERHLHRVRLVIGHIKRQEWDDDPEPKEIGELPRWKARMEAALRSGDRHRANALICSHALAPRRRAR